MRDDWRRRLLRPIVSDGIAALVLVLFVVTSSRSITGDGREYVLMAQRLAQGKSPDAPIAEALIAGVYEPRLINRHGHQEMWHFWFYPTCAAPVVSFTTFIGASPVVGFGVFNAFLLWLAFSIIRRRSGTWAATFVCLSPIIWWTDKAQSEVFTFALLAIGFTLLERPPWAALTFAIAATQNPPIALLVGLMVVKATRCRNVHRFEIWLWLVVFILLALHPLYYWVRLGRLTPLVDGSDIRIPGWRTLMTPLVDLNLGLFLNAPILATVLISKSAELACMPSRRERAILVAGVYVIFLLAFAQAPNVNSGGTPGMTRYALWFIPPSVALISHTSGWQRTRPFAAATFGSALWSLLFFAPFLPEAYLSPTPFALYVWSHYPSLENPLPEVFAERLRHSDGVNTLASTPNCAKALIQNGQWPLPCVPTGIPASQCGVEGALCYANRRADGGYDFVVTGRRGGVRLTQIFSNLRLTVSSFRTRVRTTVQIRGIV
jgi:hypothetical protein